MFQINKFQIPNGDAGQVARILNRMPSKEIEQDIEARY